MTAPGGPSAVGSSAVGSSAGASSAVGWAAGSPPAARPRGRLRLDCLYVGWQQLLAEPDPGPAPGPAAHREPHTVSRAWVTAQHQEHRRLGRPPRLGATAGLLTTTAATAGCLGRLLGAWPALLLAGAGAWLTAAGCLRLVRAEQAHHRQLRAEAHRVARCREVQLADRAAREREHVRQLRDWQQRAASFRRQAHWYPVTLPATVHRLDVAGGTLAGWSALTTMIAVPRLAAGGEVTVIDLTEGGVAADLLAVARRSGLGPQVWVLPADLPQLNLGAPARADLLADTLARTVSAADRMAPAAAAGASGPSPADLALDTSLLTRVLGVVGAPGSLESPDGAPVVARLVAALRALGQIGGPAEHLQSAALSPAQLAGLGALAGRGAERLVIERAWALEARLRTLSPLAGDLAGRPASRLKVAWLDRRAAGVGNEVLAAYLAVALTAVLRQAPPARRWQHTIILLGGERLPGDVLDRLCHAAEIAGAGLVLGYRTIPQHARERLGRGDAAVGFMRLGNAEDARLAAEQIGTEHRFVVSQLTDSVGATVTDTIGLSYSSSAGTSETGSDSVTRSSGRGSGRSRHGAAAPLGGLLGGPAGREASTSAGISDSQSISEGISTGTSWGWSTARAIGASDSLASTAQRSRESLVEQHELQQLPQSAVLLCYPAPGGRRVVLADANPAILTLPTATLASLPADAPG
ncbi:MAG TPA: hypothetical protein VMR00_20310 [Streptosporangiaceae bacterium]|nr:hypothetical protein [Streptosporangiaceae bacterium]